MRTRLYPFLNRALYLIAAILSFLILGLNLFFHTTVSYDVCEYVNVFGYLLPGLKMMILTAGLFLLVWRFQNALKKIRQEWLFLLFSAVYIVIASYLILNSNHVISADPFLVYQAALEVKAGDFSSFQPGGYIHCFPHQLGLLCYDALLTGIAQTPVIFFVVNTALTLGCNFICWKISMELSQNRLVHLLTLFFSFAFLPQLFLIMFAYGLLPGWFFLQLSFFCTLRFCRTGSWKHGLGMLASAAAAILLRKNNLIGLIAMVLYLLLQYLRVPRKRLLTAALAVAVCMVLPGKLLRIGFETYTDAQLNEPTPSALWVAMGTNIDNRTSGPGWYDGTTYWVYENKKPEADITAMAKAMLGQNIDKIRQEPSKAAYFFRDKMISTWCEPLYQSIWSGPKPSDGQATTTPFLQALYSGGHPEDVLENYAKWLSLTIWTGVCLFFLRGKADKADWQLMFGYLTGGFLFHLIWETKSQYVYPYVFALLPFAACGFCRLLDRFGQSGGKSEINKFFS